METIHLWTEGARREAGELAVSARIEFPPGRKADLWFRLPEDHGVEPTTSSDPFLIAAVFPLMEHARASGHPCRIEVHGEASPSLMWNLSEFQRAWSMWRPDLYATAAVEAEIEEEAVAPEAAGGDAVMCFSGGVDSSFTAFRHAGPNRETNAHRLRAGVMVQGWEYSLEQKELFARAEKRSQRIIGSLGLPLIRITTNFRQVVSRWPHSHGAALASCLSLLRGSFRTALVAQTMTYRTNHLSLEGVNPMTDWLLSSDGFRFIPDGAGHSRLQKIDALREWPEFLHNVRVCWEDEIEKSENCCACEKCIRTILQFRVLGLGLPPAFPKDVADRQIRALAMSRRRLATTYEPILEEAKNRGIHEEWVQTVDRAVRRARRAARMAPLPSWRKLHYLAYQKARALLGRR